VVIAATWGEGEPPRAPVRAYGELMSDKAPRLDGVEFGVLALGDTAYVEFCAVGKQSTLVSPRSAANAWSSASTAISILPIPLRSGSIKRWKSSFR